MKVTRTLSFEVDNQAIIDGWKTAYLNKYSKGEVTTEDIIDYVYNCFDIDESEVREFATIYGGEDWFREQVVEPIVEQILDAAASADMSFMVYYGDTSTGNPPEYRQYFHTAFQAIEHAIDVSYEREKTVYIKDLAEQEDLQVYAFKGEVYCDYEPEAMEDDGWDV